MALPLNTLMNKYSALVVVVEFEIRKWLSRPTPDLVSWSVSLSLWISLSLLTEYCGATAHSSELSSLLYLPWWTETRKYYQHSELSYFCEKNYFANNNRILGDLFGEKFVSSFLVVMEWCKSTQENYRNRIL